MQETEAAVSDEQEVPAEHRMYPAGAVMLQPVTPSLPTEGVTGKRPIPHQKP